MSLFAAPSSSTPLTVTVCALHQSVVVKVSEVAFVKVSESRLTVATAASRELIVTVTSLPGSVFSLTVNLAVCPSSISRFEGLIATPAMSLSTNVTATLAVASMS